MTGERELATLSPKRPVPLRRTWLRNRWEELAFVHWRYDPDVVQSLLPDGLRVDTIDGAAFVSLIPFRMADASPRFVPAIPWLSSFAETNVRTYVVDSAGNRAIWFFSLEAARLPIVVFARAALGFPYVWSEMSIEVGGDRRRYETRRRRWPSRPASSTVVELEVGEPIVEQSPLDVFLTARWGTVARWPGRPGAPRDGRGRLRHHPVDHPAWSLHEATLVEYHDRSIEAAGLPEPAGEPVVRWAKPIPAYFAAPEKL
jgi:uncharacterized protein